MPEMGLFFKLFIKIKRDEKVVSGGGSSLAGKHRIQEHCCLLYWGPGISILLLQGFALWSGCPSRAAKVDGWMGEKFQGTHAHPREAAMSQREKKVWLEKKNLRAQTCWVKGVGNANH